MHILICQQRLFSRLAKKQELSAKLKNAITAEDIATADAVILTTDMPIKNAGRFDNLKKVKITTGQAIKQADAIVAKMVGMLK